MSRAAERWLFPGLLLLAVVLALGTAGWGRLYNETDGQYGGAAKVMAEGGSWLIPENNGVPRLVKPPLLYWGMAGAMRIFGVNEFAARLPGALAIIAWVAFTYGIGRRMGGEWRGFLAGAILLTSLGTFTLGRIVMPEPVFSALIAGALYCLLRGVDDERRRRLWYAGFWICASLASFSKGWHGLIYPLAIVGLAALACWPARRSLSGLFSWQGAAIFLAINLPWYFYVESRFPGWLGNLLFTEQMGHVTGSSAPATNYTVVPRWQFLLLHCAWFFPWSLVVIAWVGGHFTEVFKRLRRMLFKPVAGDFAFIVVLMWIVAVLGSVLLAGQRQDYYAMSMWPAVALIAAAVVERGVKRWVPGGLAVLLFAATTGLLLLPGLLTAPTAATAERSTAWTTMTQLGPEVWKDLVFAGGLGLGVAALFCVGAAVFGGGRAGVLCLIGAAAAAAMAAAAGFAKVSGEFSIAEAAGVIRAEPAREIFYDGDVDTGSSLLFYVGDEIGLLDQNADEDFIVRKFGIGRDRYVKSEDLAARWKSPGTATLVTEQERLPYWEEKLGQKLVVQGRAGTQIVLKN